MDFSKEGDRHEISNKMWFTGWEEKGIEMHSVQTAQYYWYDYEGLKLLKRYGVSKFSYDDIWDFDWEALRLKALEEKHIDSFNMPIKAPHPFIRKLVIKLLRQTDVGLRQFKMLLWSKS